MKLCMYTEVQQSHCITVSYGLKIESFIFILFTHLKHDTTSNREKWGWKVHKLFIRAIDNKGEQNLQKFPRYVTICLSTFVAQ